MITPWDIEKKTMTPEKRAIACNDYFAFYIGRPLSYVLTIPFLYTSISPNAVSVISVIPIIIGFYFACIARTTNELLFSWAMYFLWNLLDGVDGNIARYKKEFSPLGSVYDATSGYIAMVLTFFGWGVAAAHNGGVLNGFLILDMDIYIILGALSGIFVIFPRFIMHKVISTVGRGSSVDNLQNKANYGFVKIIALNLISISGFVQVLMLIAIFMNLLDFFTIGYFILNFVVMIVSMYKVLKV